MSYYYIDGNRFDSLEDTVEHIIKGISCDRSKILREYISNLLQTIEKMKCGQNCKHSYLYQEDRKCKFTYCDCINCKDKWEIKENAD